MAKLKECALSLLSATAIADLSAVQENLVYTVPAGKKCILSEGYLECAGDVGANLVCTAGQDSAPSDFVGTTNGDNLDADEDAICMKPVPSATPTKMKIYPAGTLIKLDVTVGGNAVAGVYYLFGFLIDV